jgi:hypothetical protein
MVGMSKRNPAPAHRFDVARFKELAERVNLTVDEFLEFLDSPPGRRLRRIIATGMIVSVPLVMRIPGLRRTPIGRAVELLGGAALVVRLAEAVRDWEHAGGPKAGPGPVIDVPPVA